MSKQTRDSKKSAYELQHTPDTPISNDLFIFDRDDSAAKQDTSEEAQPSKKETQPETEAEQPAEAERTTTISVSQSTRLKIQALQQLDIAPSYKDVVEQAVEEMAERLSPKQQEIYQLLLDILFRNK